MVIDASSMSRPDLSKCVVAPAMRYLFARDPGVQPAHLATVTVHRRKQPAVSRMSSGIVKTAKRLFAFENVTRNVTTSAGSGMKATESTASFIPAIPLGFAGAEPIGKERVDTLTVSAATSLSEEDDVEDFDTFEEALLARNAIAPTTARESLRSSTPPAVFHASAPTLFSTHDGQERISWYALADSCVAKSRRRLRLRKKILAPLLERAARRFDQAKMRACARPAPHGYGNGFYECPCPRCERACRLECAVDDTVAEWKKIASRYFKDI